MKNYLFTVYLIGQGDNPDEAWNDAIDHFIVDPGSTPEKDQYREIEDDE